MAGNLTKQAIRMSFIKLLNERPLDKITVKDVVMDCGVNRNTFYYHYQDIFALLEDVLRREAAEILEKNSRCGSWKDAVNLAVDFALNNRRAVYHVYNSSRREQLEGYLNPVAGAVMEEYIRSRAQGMSISDEDIHILAMFYKNAAVGSFREWMQRGMRDDPEHIIDRLGKLLQNSIVNALENA